MKKIFMVILLAVILGAAFASCTSSKAGCKANADMIGYH
jgi:hypothetical protein